MQRIKLGIKHQTILVTREKRVKITTVILMLSKTFQAWHSLYYGLVSSS